MRRMMRKMQHDVLMNLAGEPVELHPKTEHVLAAMRVRLPEDMDRVDALRVLNSIFEALSYADSHEFTKDV